VGRKAAGRQECARRECAELLTYRALFRGEAQGGRSPSQGHLGAPHKGTSEPQEAACRSPQQAAGSSSIVRSRGTTVLRYYIHVVDLAYIHTSTGTGTVPQYRSVDQGKYMYRYRYRYRYYYSTT
jgi:hypothetical protein